MMRFISRSPSPTEAFDMETVRADPYGSGRPPEVGRPLFGSADEHIPVGQVRHPSPEKVRVVGLADARAQPRAVRATPTGQPDHMQTAIAGELLQFLLEQWTTREPVQQHSFAGGVVESFGERAERGDSDTGSHQCDPAAGASAGGESPVRPFDQYASSGAQISQRAAAVADLLHADPELVVRRRRRQRVGVCPGPTGARQKPKAEELARLRGNSASADG